jgi:hypothetical protein
MEEIEAKQEEVVAGVGTPNGLEPSCPAEAGNPSPLRVTPAGQASGPEGAARRVSFSELLGGGLATVLP